MVEEATEEVMEAKEGGAGWACWVHEEGLLGEGREAWGGREEGEAEGGEEEGGAMAAQGV